VDVQKDKSVAFIILHPED